MIKPIKKKLVYNSGLINSKSDRLTAKMINLLVDKINELVRDNEQLRNEIQEIKNT